MNKKVKIPQPEDPRLRDILYCVDNGLRKLVSVKNWGMPPYRWNGIVNSHHSEYYEEDAPEYVTVALRITYYGGNGPTSGWQCWITINDADDGYAQRWWHFTLENWNEALKVYNEIDQVDHELVHDYYCKELGFK